MILSHSPKIQYRALTFLTMLYLTIIIAANIMIYKLVIVGGITLSSGAFLIPIWFILGDIIAEIYGYEASKRVIWFTLVCLFIFSIICELLITLPSPLTWTHQPDYNYVTGSLVRIFIGLFIAVIFGSFLNAYLITKWKVLIKGKYFWMRSLGSSLIGHVIFTIVTISFDLYGKIPTAALAKLIYISFPFKIILLTIGIIPATIIVAFLKRFENIDVYDTYLNFNPFKMNSSA